MNTDAATPACLSPNEQTLGSWIRARLASGDLPMAGETMTGGPGTQKTCIVCLTTINPQQVELEVSDSGGGVVVSHLDCYRLWRLETLHRRSHIADP